MSAQYAQFNFRDDRAPVDATRALIQSLQDGVSDIDRTFAHVGGRFGEGLELFDGLKGRLLALSGEINHPELTQARQALEVLTGELPDVETRLDREKAALARLNERSQSVGRVFGALRSNMRLVSVLTQRARIERASIRGPARDLDSFTDEIVTLSHRARQVVEDCARRHEGVVAQVALAVKSQAEFERRFGRSLSRLAEELSLTLAALAVRQSKSVGAVGDMAKHSSNVVAATGNAVMALQTGDNIRQRIEHAITALEMGDVPVPHVRPLIARLQAAQLRSTAQLLNAESRKVDQSILLLGDETNTLVSVVRAFLGGGGGQDSSSLVEELKAGLGTATELLHKCEADRRTVDDVMSRLTGFLEGFEETVASLRKTAVNIVFLGTNAGLRASHLGEEGKGLIVIARELKIAADLVERDARAMGEIFAAMLSAAAELRACTMESNNLAAFDATVQQSMQAIGQSGDRLSELLRCLDDEAVRFVVEVTSARRAFSIMAQRSQTVLDAARQLEASGGNDLPFPGDPSLQEAKKFIDENVFPLYSMSAERDIHRNMFLELNIDEADVVEKLPILPDLAESGTFIEF